MEKKRDSHHAGCYRRVSDLEHEHQGCEREDKSEKIAKVSRESDRSSGMSSGQSSSSSRSALTNSFLRPSLLRVKGDAQENNHQNSRDHQNNNKVVSENVFRFTPLSNVPDSLATSSSRIFDTPNPTKKARVSPEPNNESSEGNGSTEESSQPAKAVSSQSSDHPSPVSQTQTENPFLSSSSTSSGVSSGLLPNSSGQPVENDNDGESFVFGQNLTDRAVVIAKESDELSKTSEEIEDGKNDLKPSNEEDVNSKSPNTEKRKYEAITGEEDEDNVMQLYCKLYFWQSGQNQWVERGKGMLRLNDRNDEGDKMTSRLVMRTAGSYRLILNCVIVPGMKIQLPKEHCLRFTDVEGIFLVKGKDKDIDNLYAAIEHRLHEISTHVNDDFKTQNELEEKKEADTDEGKSNEADSEDETQVEDVTPVEKETRVGHETPLETSKSVHEEVADPV